MIRMDENGVCIRLHIVPLGLSEANELVRRWHRHHRATVGHKFSLGVASEDSVIHGAAIVGRPVSRVLARDGFTLEVLRCVTDGTVNACSALYGACWRAARAMGYRRLVTYITESEPGTSLRAAGWREVGKSHGRGWNVPSRPRVDKHALGPKLRFEVSA
jgi:hypothetical protein